MEKTLLLFKQSKFILLFFLILFSCSNLIAQSDTLIIGYKDGVTHNQKAILPNILNMKTVDSILLFNQYKYVLPDTIDIDSLPISGSLKVTLIAELGGNEIFDAEKKKRIARKSGKEKMAGAEGADLNFTLKLDLPDDSYPTCDSSHCIFGVSTPITKSICSLSIVNNFVKIGVLDTGIDPVIGIQNQVMSTGYDLVKSPNAMPSLSPTDDYHNDFHGTKVAQEIVAAGCCSNQMELISFRALNNQGEGRLWDFIKGVALAINEGVCVLNISAGYTDTSSLVVGEKQPLEKAIEVAGTYGILVVTSAGNATADNDILPHFPSNYSHMSHVMAVGASCNDHLEGYSNFGTNLVTLTTEGDYSAIDKGTSYAAAVVSGFAGLLQMNAPPEAFCNPSALKTIMEQHALPEVTATGGELMPYQTLLNWQISFPDSPMPLISQNGGNTNETSSAYLTHKTYPSPFQDHFSIELTLEIDAIAEIFVTNLNGQLIAHTQKEGNRGTNIWEIMELAFQPSGIYFLQMKIGEEIFSQKVVKL